ncbi:hypothetical protein SDC9_12454 [bioreactor metagenome]|uniref:Uncharacterized protein n=1 Tax=bioreactor metagenome TaxID=1076179 RepID=A0A644TIJ5_9ZZZZ
MQIKTTAWNKPCRIVRRLARSKNGFFDFGSENYGGMTATNTVKIDVRAYQKNNRSPSNVATARHVARLK